SAMSALTRSAMGANSAGVIGGGGGGAGVGVVVVTGVCVAVGVVVVVMIGAGAGRPQGGRTTRASAVGQTRITWATGVQSARAKSLSGSVLHPLRQHASGYRKGRRADLEGWE